MTAERLPPSLRYSGCIEKNGRPEAWPGTATLLVACAGARVPAVGHDLRRGRPRRGEAAVRRGAHVIDQQSVVMRRRHSATVRDLLAGGARATLEQGHLRAGRERYEAAYRLAERDDDAVAMATAALGLGGIWVQEHRTAAASVQLKARLRRALSLLGQDDPLAQRIRVRLAAEDNYQHGDHAAILAELSEARTSADPVVWAEALSLAHDCLMGPDYGALRRDLATELIAASYTTGRRSDLLLGVLWQTADLLLDGDPHTGRRLGELRQLLAEEDHLAIGYIVSSIDVMLAIRTGRLAEAEDLSRRCLQRGLAVGDIDAAGWHGAQLVAIRWYQGRLAELRPALAEMADSPTLSESDNAFRAALALTAALAGDRRQAASALAALCDGDLSERPRSASWLAMMSGIAETALLLDDRATAARVGELLGPYAHLPMIGGLAACFGSARHALGVASLACGDLDAAVGHFRAAVQQNLALAHAPATVMSRRRLAEALARRAGPPDAAEAEAQLAAAAADASALGMAVISVDRPGAATPAAACRRQGRSWRIDVAGRSTVVEHSIGLLHLAVLIANPRQEIPAIDLAAGLAALGEAGRRTLASEQPMLDPDAVRAYRRRLAQLEEQAGRPGSRDDGQIAVRDRAERDWLENELAGATGMSGRPRSFADEAERARISVGKAIRRALARITDADPVIGDQLQQAVRTGVRCSYWPA
jgi:hypothetical protein